MSEARPHRRPDLRRPGGRHRNAAQRLRRARRVHRPHLERRGKLIPLEGKVREACPPTIEHVITNWTGPDHPVETRQLDSEAPALLLYTSGTTGKPKGCIHTHAGALAQTAKEIWLAFDHKDSDIFFWLSDIGWMMGPWTIIGNHHFGGTIFMYDGAPDYPTADRLWQALERNRITTFGVSPTAIRVLMRNSDPSHHYSMRCACSGPPESRGMKRRISGFRKRAAAFVPIINISGGTEIAGFLFPLPIQPLKPCTLGAPAPGVAVEILDDAGEPVPQGTTGYLACTKLRPFHDPRHLGRPRALSRSLLVQVAAPLEPRRLDQCRPGRLLVSARRADESMNVAGRKVGPA